MLGCRHTSQHHHLAVERSLLGSYRIVHGRDVEWMAPSLGVERRG